MRLIIIPLLSFFILASLFLIDFRSVLHAQTTPPKISLYMEPTSLSVTTGTNFSVPVKLDTGTTAINAVQADISYPANLLQVESISETGSAFALSVVKTGSGGNISIVRGSLTPVKGNKLLIATINFKPLSSGIAPLEFKESSAAVNGPVDSLTDSPDLILTISHPLSPTSPQSPKPSPSPSASPSPVPSPSPSAKTSIIKIYAAGTPALNVYPDIKLEVKNPSNNSWQNVKTFSNVKGNINNRSFMEFIHTHKTKLKPSDIRLRFSNDWFKPYAEDRNLIIDKINLDGVDIQSEKDSIYSTGTWTNATGCAGGFKKSEWLHCNGFFEYR